MQNKQKMCLKAIDSQIMRQIISDGVCFFGESTTPYGVAHIVWCPQGLLLMSFQTGSDVPGLIDLKQRLDDLDWQRDDIKTQELSRQLFHNTCTLPLLMVGTSFQLKVLQAIQSVPAGSTITYKELANVINNPKAIRAVGSALARNPFACIVPCHRALRSDGGLGGFRWGLDLKQQLLDKEK